jgi:PKD repeat protein
MAYYLHRIKKVILRESLIVFIFILLSSANVFGQCPTADAGSDQSICISDISISINGTATNDSSIVWQTTGDGVFNANMEDPVYTPGTNDKANGNVILTMLVYQKYSLCAPGSSNPASNSMTLTIEPEPTANAGFDATICETNTHSLSGSASDYSSLTWATSGDGTFSNSSTLNPVYTPGSGDISSGTVNITFTAQPNSPCSTAASDFMVLTITQQPTAVAGADASICEGESYSISAASATNYFSILWTSNGDGAFSNASIENPTYTPGTNDISNGLVILTITSQPNSPCGSSVSDNLTLTIQANPTVNANADQTICASSSASLSGSATNYDLSSIIWTAVGGGTFSSTSVLDPIFTPSASQISAGVAVLTLSVTGSGACTSTVTDEMTISITAEPTAEAGLSSTICETGSYTISGASVNNQSSYSWSTSGDGTFANGNTLSPTYTPGSTDITNGSATITLSAQSISPCSIAANDNLTITINNAPTVDAGPIATICENSTHTLNATATNYSTLAWISSGDGSFNNTSLEDPVYTPGTNDILNGTVTLTLEATPNAPCSGAVTDNMILTITSEPVVNAGIDQTICEDQSPTLTGNVSGVYSSILWTSSGGGSFSNSATLNTVYFPSPSEIIAGVANITLTATASAACSGTYSDDLTIFITPLPSVNAGSDVVQCNLNGINLNATATNHLAGSIVWSTSGNGTFSATNILNPIYTPNAADLAAGTVNLTFEVTGQSPCNSTVSDFLTLTLYDAVTVNAGVDVNICNAPYNLNATVEYASSLAWTTSGDGTFSNSTIEDPVYTPGTVDITNGTVTLTLVAQATSPCVGSTSDDVILTILSSPVITAGTDATICETTINYSLSGASVSGSGSILWTSSGSGAFDNPADQNPTYTPSIADYANGSTVLTLTVSNAPCPDQTDQMTLTYQHEPTIDAGNNITICDGETVNISTAVSANVDVISWSTSGTGTFSNSSILNPTYNPSVADYLAGSLTLTITGTATSPCSGMVSDQMTVNVVTAPSAYAGPNATICETDNYAITSSSVSNNISLTWSSSGDGSFDDINILFPTYTPGTNDLIIGSVTLTLTAFSNPPCSSSVTHSMVLSLEPAPQADAGNDETICEGSIVTLSSANAIDYSNLLWTTSGTGSFSDATIENPIYTPSAADIALTGITLTLTATGNIPCSGSTADNMTLNITPNPVVNVGSDASICENDNYIISSSTASYYSTIVWTTSGSGSFSNVNALNPTYTPSAIDIVAGSVTLQLTAISNAPCTGSVSDDFLLTFEPLATVNAGANDNVCEGSNFSTNPTASNYASILWTTTGDGIFANANMLNTIYTPGTNDISNGTTDLTITATNNASCTGTVASTMTLTITPEPIVNAGADEEICESSFTILNASVSNHSTLLWTSSGSSGTLINETTLQPTYTPSAVDIANGNVTLTLTAQPISPCSNVISDDVIISISESPEANAGVDATICESNDFTVAGASVNNQSSFSWSTSGTGTFINSATLSPTYSPSVNDITNGSVILSLTAEPNAPCTSPDTDDMTLTFETLPIIDAGSSNSVCEGSSFTNLDATATNASSLLWTSSGTGIFTDNSILNATYSPSALDILNGSVHLTLTANSNAPCVTSVNDVLTLTIINEPTADAGPDESVCEDANFDISGAIATNHSSVLWGTSGSGTILNANSLTPTYVPSTADISLGSVTLSLTAYGISPCTASITNSMILSFNPNPEVFAGADNIICESVAYTISDATASNYSSVLWTTTGTGTLTNANTTNPTYSPDAGDVISGTVVLTLTATPIAPCTSSQSDEIILTIEGSPNAFAGLDATICELENYDIIDATASNYTSILWTSSGTGLFSNAASVNPTYLPSSADYASGSVNLTLTATGNAPCSGTHSDNMVITFTYSPTVDAGSDISTCENSSIQISTATANNYSSLNWTHNGSGTLTNAGRINPTYTTGTNDATLGTITLTLTATANGSCSPISDAAILTIIKNPTVNAGNDVDICEGSTYSIVDATANNYSSILWTSSGSGSFSNSAILDPIYIPSAADYSSGAVLITLTANPNTPCSSSIDDSFTMIFMDAPTAFAGNDESICESNNFTVSTADATNFSSLVWSTSGNGTFQNQTTLTPTYIPSSNDIILGSVDLTITVSGNIGCSDVSDIMTLSISDSPEVDAGLDASICEGDDFTITSSSVSNSTSIGWTSSGTGSFINGNTINPTYTPSAADITNGMVVLTLVADATAPCTGQETDFMTLTITNAPDAFAGNDATICSGEEYSLSEATAENYSTVNWTTSGTGTFININTVNSIYVPSSVDITNGSVNLTLEAVAQGACTINASDFMVLSFSDSPVIFAGADATICEDANYINTDATASNHSGLLWTSSGTGIFSDAANLHPNYTPSNDDINNGIVTLTLTGTGINTCPDVSSELILTILQNPEVNTPSNLTICEVESVINGASAQNYSSLVWTTSGTGSFLDNSVISPTYTPSAGDIVAGNVILTLTAQANNPCSTSSSDQISVNISQNPTAYAGPDGSICENNTFTISGASVNNQSSFTWTSNGSGTLSNITTLNPSYTPSNADILSGSVIITLTAEPQSPCSNTVTDEMTISFELLPTVEAGSSTTICEGNSYTIFDASVNNEASFIWTSTGSGLFNNTSLLNPTYTPSATDIANGGVQLILTATGNLPCATTVSDAMDLVINLEATADAGPDVSICEDATHTISGATASNYSSVLWTSTGLGTLLNETTLTPTYIPNAIDISLGSVTLELTAYSQGPCVNSATSQMIITIDPLPTVFAGDDNSVCENTGYTVTDATASNYSTIIWTTTGTGTLTNENTLTPTYTPDAADVANGTVVLRLTASQVSPCTSSQFDDLVLTIIDGPNVFAGDDNTICENDSYNLIDATAENYTSVLWTSSGTGIFSNSATVNPTYVPSAADYITTSVVLTLTVTGDAVCATSLSDNMVLTFTPASTANAGVDDDVCEDSFYQITTATASNYTSINWTHNGNGVLTNAGTLSPTYTPALIDASMGVVTLTMSVQGNGSCGSDSDQMQLNIIANPIVDAGPDQIGCAGSNFSIVNATASNYSTLLWTTSGTGTFSNPGIIDPIYIPSAMDISNGSVLLTLTANANTPCFNSQSDSFILTLEPSATANAGADANVCEGSDHTISGASATNFSSITWNSSGSGTFVNQNTLTPTYSPSVTDVLLGSVTLTMDVVGNPPCGNTFDDMLLTITSSPSAFAGLDASICEGDDHTIVTASASNYSTLFWITSGTGSFLDGNSLTPTYTPSVADIANGSVLLTLTVNSNSPCSGQITDFMNLVIISEPVIDAGVDATICSGDNFHNTNASASNYESLSWTTTGSGTFINGNTISPIYAPSSADITSGSVILTLTASSASPCTTTVTDAIILTFNEGAIVDAGLAFTICETDNYTNTDAVVSNASSLLWTTAGSGTFTDATILNTTYIPSANDIINGVVTLTLTANSNPPCASDSDDVTITINASPVVDAGTMTDICENATLIVGATANNYSTLSWTTSGTGTFVNADQIQPTYNPSAADITAGNVTLTLTADPLAPCLNSVSSSILVNIQQEAIVDAGPNDIVCGSTPYALTGATQTNANSISWASSGTGVFSDPNTLNPLYTPSAADAIAGAVTLTIEANSIACGTSSDFMTLTVNSMPMIDAGDDASVCVNGTFTANGVISGTYTSIAWTHNGAGILTQENTLTPIYAPDISEIGNTVILTMTVTASTPCPGTISDALSLVINDESIAGAGPDATICETDFYTVVGATASNYTNIFWSTSGDGSFTAGGSLMPTYIPGPNDLLNGFTDLTIHVQNPPCQDATDQMRLTFGYQPIVDAGPNATIDIGTSFTVTSASIVGNYTSFVWTTSGTGTFDDNNLLGPTYTPSADDFSLGSVHLTLEVSGSTPCNTLVSDYMILTIGNAPAADFTWTNPCLGSPVQFLIDATVTDIPSITDWYWDFDDGTNSTLMEPEHTYSVPGFYNVTLRVTNTDGYTNTVMNIVEVYELPVALFNFDSPSCSGSLAQFYDYSNTSEGYIQQWDWDFGDGNTTTVNFPDNPDVSHLYANTGIYEVILTVSTSLGCSASYFANITIEPSPIAAFDFSSTCSGDLTNFNDLSVANGGGDIISWEWDFGDPLTGINNNSTLQNPQHLFSANGVFDVTLIINSSIGCADTLIQTITIEDAPSLDFSFITACLNQETEFIVDETVTDITNVSTWFWEFGDGINSNAMNPTHTYNGIGTYYVTLTIVTLNGCENSIQHEVEVNPLPIARFEYTSPACQGDSTYFTNTSFSPNGAILQWIWDFGDGNITTINSPDNPNVAHLYANNTIFEATLTVVDQEGCENSSSHLIEILAGPLADFTHDESCFGVPVLFTDISSQNGGPDLYSWEWYFGDPNSGIENSSNSQNPSHSFTDPGTYSVTLIVANTFGCTDTVIHDVIVDSLPNIDFTMADDTICANQLAEFTATGNNINTWFWEFGDGGTSIDQNPDYLYSSTGTYTVTLTATGADGCTNSVSHIIEVRPEPSANFSYEQPLCSTSDVQFLDYSTTPLGYIMEWIWDFGDGTTTTIQHPDDPNVTHSYATPGTYSVTLVIMNSDSCVSNVTNNVVIIPSPTANFSFSDGCFGQSIEFTDLSTQTGGEIVSWEWDFGDPASGTANASTAQNPSHLFSAGGDFDVTLIIGDINGCGDTIVQTVSMGDPPAVEFTFTVACFGMPTQFSVDETVTDVANVQIFDWDFGDGNTSNSQNPAYTYATMGTYEVILTITTVDGCMNSISHTVEITPLPNANFEHTAPVCLGDTIYFTDMSSSQNGTIATWFWDFGDGTNITINDPDNPDVSHLYLNDVSYDVALTVTDTEGCEHTMIKQIQVIASPIADFNYEETCFNEPVIFTDMSSTNNGVDISSWEWFFGDPESGVDNFSNLQHPTHIFTNPGTYTTTLIVGSTLGCTDTTFQEIIIDSLPSVDFTVLDDSICFGELAEFTGIGTDISTWFWEFGDGGVSIEQNPTYMYAAPGIYQVTLTVTEIGTDQCQNSISHEVYVNDAPVSHFEYENNCLGDSTYFTDQSYSETGFVESWQWHFGDGNTSILEDPVHYYSDNDDYEVTLITIDNFGCSDTIVQIIQIFDKPVPGFVFNQLCDPAGQINFFDESVVGEDNSPIVEWNWNLYEGYYSTEIDPSYIYPATDTCYTVILQVTDGNGCVARDTNTQVCLHGTLEIEFTSTEECFGNTTFFDASYIPASDLVASYTWNFNDGSPAISTFRDTISHLFPNPGQYVVELMALDTNGCNTSIFRDVIVDSLPTPKFSNTTGNCTTPTEFTDLSFGGGEFIESWYWDFGDIISGSNNFSTLQNPSHLYGPSDSTYLVKLIVTNFNGCQDSVIQEVFVDPCLSADFELPADPICSRFEICFTDISQVQSSSGAISQWQWDFGDGNTYSYGSLENPICHTYADNGDYIVQLIITATINGTDYFDTATNVLSVNPTPIAAIQVENNCFSDSTYFYDATDNLGEPLTMWWWNFGDNSNPNDTAIIENPVYLYPSYGKYETELKVMNQYGCRDSITNFVNIFKPPEAAFQIDETCVSYYTYFTDESIADSSDIINYSWNFGDTLTASDISNLPNPDYIYDSVGFYNVNLVIIDGNQCTDSISHELEIYPIPTSAFTIFDTIQQGQIYLENQSQEAESYYWDFDYNYGISTTETSPLHQYEEDGDYNIMLVAYNNYGCPDTTFQMHNVLFTNLFVPNAFIPSNSNPELNKFKPKGINLKSYSIEIFSAWGNKVFESTLLEDGIPVEAWDGTYLDEQLPTGTYIWRISAVFVNGDFWKGSDNGDGNVNTTGTVTLIR